MARYLLECTIDPTKMHVLAAKRAEHYEFLIARERDIVFGGPARAREDGPPQIMLIVVEAASMQDAQAFIDAEPYNSSGGFSSITIRLWNQVIPELAAGSLQRTLDAERVSHTPKPGGLQR